MAARLTQVPLPWLPEGAVEVARGVGIVAGEDGSGQVWVHGMLAFCWGAGDEASLRLAMVQLTVHLKAASMRQAADALGIESSTISRWAASYAKEGLAGLVPAVRGPKGPSKLTAKLVSRIRGLRAEGKSLEAISGLCGVSVFSVRCALGLVPERRTAIAKLAGSFPDDGQPAAGGAGAGGEEGEEGEEAGGGGGGGQELRVLPDPVPRDGERALARFGLLGEGAEPVFTPGARYPLAGLLLVLPALAGTGLLQSARQVYGRLRNGFYGLETVLVLLVFLALARRALRVPPGSRLRRWAACWAWTGRRRSGRSAASWASWPPPGRPRSCSWRSPAATPGPGRMSWGSC
jgi:Helix-turn-helix domain